ncbi:hypothetical protein CVT26_013890 [Gymnopilus dilepis]|uniref:Uncharacterized protein n=1 Tax=Gymnopilus dilepis TaxID=231916 RepID=A0A409Y698_9AGAR|nr:hypothetical protein CVT26_013890 [Gymnopilus dilepis]
MSSSLGSEQTGVKEALGLPVQLMKPPDTYIWLYQELFLYMTPRENKFQSYSTRRTREIKHGALTKTLYISML